MGPVTDAARRALKGKLPQRYHHGLDLRPQFDAVVEPFLASATSVLDVGAGRSPTYPPGDRPESVRYVGLDLSASELDAAPDGSYEEVFVSDVTQLVPSLQRQFDLIVSWQVLEHVRPTHAAIDNLRSYLRPGGHLVAQFSGTFGLFGLLSRAVPDRVTPWLLQKLFARPRATTFPAYYDHCWATALEGMGTAWTAFEVRPRHEGAGYFGFSRHVRAGYLAYEEWAVRGCRKNLASYYIVIGER